MDSINRSYELELTVSGNSIVSNLNELKQALTEDFGKYSKLVIPVEQMDDKTYKELKAQRTAMNKLYKSFNDERIGRVKNIQNLLKTTKSMVDDSIQVLADGSENIGKILKDYDDLKKEKAYRKAEETFQEVTSSTTDFKELNLNLSDIVNMDTEKFESLLNKPNLIKEYFVAKLNTIVADLKAIEHSEYKEKEYLKAIYFKVGLNISIEHSEYKEKEYLKAIYFKVGLNISKAFSVYFEEKQLRDQVNQQIGAKKQQEETIKDDGETKKLVIELDEETFNVLFPTMIDLQNAGKHIKWWDFYDYIEQ